MSQRVYRTSERNRVFYKFKLVLYRPEIKRSNGETGAEMLALIRECCKILKLFIVRGERLVKLKDSWFSTKYI